MVADGVVEAGLAVDLGQVGVGGVDAVVDFRGAQHGIHRAQSPGLEIGRARDPGLEKPARGAVLGVEHVVEAVRVADAGARRVAVFAEGHAVEFGPSGEIFGGGELRGERRIRGVVGLVGHDKTVRSRAHGTVEEVFARFLLNDDLLVPLFEVRALEHRYVIPIGVFEARRKGVEHAIVLKRAGEAVALGEAREFLVARGIDQ